MNNYLVVYYRNSEPTFIYTETVDTARTYAISMAVGQKNAKNDVLSIVEVATDKIIYYGKGKNLVGELNAVARPSLLDGFTSSSLVKSFLNWIGIKFFKSAV
jgi:hypothetical protein